MEKLQREKEDIHAVNIKKKGRKNVKLYKGKNI